MKKPFKRKRFWLGLFFAGLFALLWSFDGSRTLMQQASKTPKPDKNITAIDFDNLDQAKSDLETYVYGPLTNFRNAEILSKRLVDEVAYSGKASVQEWVIRAGFGGELREFTVAIALPANNPNAPIIVQQTFCPNSAVMAMPDLTNPTGDYFDCSGEGLMASVFGYFFGRYITSPPVEMILDRGYGVATMYPHEFVPDRAVAGQEALGALYPKPDNRPGALSAWSAQFVCVSQALKSEALTDTVITYGHSRFGKTALIAAAMTGDIDGVIAHQSGTGGASLMRDKRGESIASISNGYPHWFTSRFGAYGEAPQTLTVDAHHLLAQIAPRPVLLGNARRDVWSDPNGAFNAAKAASPAWQAKGTRGLQQDRLDVFDPSQTLAFWMRPGTHGVTEEDWPVFLEFLDVHFK